MGAAASPAEKARLRVLLHQHGLKTGTALVPPIDQGLEHGPIAGEILAEYGTPDGR